MKIKIIKCRFFLCDIIKNLYSSLSSKIFEIRKRHFSYWYTRQRWYTWQYRIFLILWLFYFYCFIQNFDSYPKFVNLDEKNQFEKYWRKIVLFCVRSFDLIGFSCPSVCLAQCLMTMLGAVWTDWRGRPANIFYSLRVWLSLLWEILTAMWHIFDWYFPICQISW